ncbi:AfsR/SARP family transcriptional regulator [Streptomyces antimycoticus]
MTVEFGLLGGIEARIDGRLVDDIGHVRQRCVLAVLLVGANRPVGIDQLMERTWGEWPPQRARGTLYSYLSRLRKALEGALGHVRIDRQPVGYKLTVDPLALDLHRFRTLVAQARSSDDDRAAPLLEQALRLWRGDALAGLDSPWINGTRETFHQERLAAELNWADLQLRRGHHMEMLAQLSARAEQHPLDERVAGQLILALYRSGRSADALNDFGAVRRRLAEELGTDPGPALQRLHQQILKSDPALHLPDSAATVPEAGQVRVSVSRQMPTSPTLLSRRGSELATWDSTLNDLAEDGSARAFPPIHGRPPGSLAEVVPASAGGCNCLPRDLPDFTGRGEELALLVKSADEGTAVHTIDGMAGVGKSALGVHAGHLLADRFPDGALFVDLQGHSAGKTPLTPKKALEVLLGQLGISTIGDTQTLWRAKTATLRLLVVLDNAVDEVQVAPLLPPGPGLTIVTSRARLSALDGAQPLSLAVLPEEAATAFFTRILGTERASAAPDAMKRIVSQCAGLPLALRLSGARLVHRAAWPVAHLSAQLASARQQLPRLFADGEVALAFRTSHEQLPPVDQQAFRALGRHPGADADASVVAAMTGMSLPDADDALQRLVDVHLAEEAAVGRYRQHDLLRQYARSLSEDPQMIERMLDHYLRLAAEALACLEDNDVPDPGVAQAWLMAERGNLLAATQCAAADGRSGYAWRLAMVLWRFLSRNLAGDSAQFLEQGLSAAQEAVDGGEAMSNTLLALAHWSSGRVSLAYDLLATSAQSHGNPESCAHALGLLGLVHLSRGTHTAAEDHAEQAFDTLEELASLSPLGLDAKIIAYWTCGVVRGLRGQYEAALACLRAAYVTCEELGQLSPNDHVLTALARYLIALEAYEEALNYLGQARGLRQRIGDRVGEAEALILIGVAQRALGDTEHALRSQCSAVQTLDGDSRLQAYARIELGRTLSVLGHRTEAIQQYEISLALAVQGNHLHEEAQAHSLLAQMLATNDRLMAHRHDQTAAEISAQLDLQHPTSLPHLRPAGW